MEIAILQFIIRNGTLKISAGQYILSPSSLEHLFWHENAINTTIFKKWTKHKKLENTIIAVAVFLDLIIHLLFQTEMV